MPPRLAFFFGFVFVAFAIRADRKRSTITENGLFWPTLWYMVVASHPIGFWLMYWGIPIPGGGNDADGSLIDGMFYGVLMLIGMRILMLRRFEWGATFRQNRWLTALLVVMALSILWSGYPFVSFKRYIKVIGSITMAFVVLSNENPMESFLTVLRRCLYVHLPMSIICIKYFRDIGVTFDWDGSGEAWQGISTAKNTLGQVAMVGALCFFWEARKSWKEPSRRNFLLLYLFMALYLLKGSDEAVSLTSLAVGLFSLFIFGCMQLLRARPAAVRSFVLAVFSATVALIGLILVHSVVLFSTDSIFGKLITGFGRDITITGRTEIWTDVYAAASGNPLFGVGFGGFWIGREANIPWNANMTWVLGQGHSGYIDTYLQVGLIGAFLLGSVMCATLYRLLNSLADDFDFGALRITLLLTILFVNITESVYLRGDHHLWFILMIVLWAVPEPETNTVPSEDSAELVR